MIMNLWLQYECHLPPLPTPNRQIPGFDKRRYEDDWGSRFFSYQYRPPHPVPAGCLTPPSPLSPCRMPDPSAHRPEDWDLRKSVPDEDAVKPAAWLENEPTTIPNPGVCGRECVGCMWW